MTTTPTLHDVIKTGIDAALKDVHTAMPGVVVSYDKTTGFATVQPSLKRAYVGGSVVDLPRIVNVPVWQPRAKGGSAFIHMPVEKDDPVLLIFCERSIDKWKSKGGVIDPQDIRRHALSDAFALPGGYPKNKPLPSDVDGSAITVGIGDTRIVIKEDGTFTLSNATGEFITALLDALDTFVQTTLVATAIGSQPLIPHANYLAKREALNAFKGGA